VGGGKRDLLSQPDVLLLKIERKKLTPLIADPDQASREIRGVGRTIGGALLEDLDEA